MRIPAETAAEAASARAPVRSRVRRMMRVLFMGHLVEELRGSTGR
jgi:hypothetical protein